MSSLTNHRAIKVRNSIQKTNRHPDRTSTTRIPTGSAWRIFLRSAGQTAFVETVWLRWVKIAIVARLIAALWIHVAMVEPASLLTPAMSAVISQILLAAHLVSIQPLPIHVPAQVRIQGKAALAHRMELHTQDFVQMEVVKAWQPIAQISVRIFQEAGI